MVLVASRPLSQWLSPVLPQESFTPSEGNPLDRAYFLALILAGMAIILRRRHRLAGMPRRNLWLLLLYLYFLASTLWSDYPFVSFKRWFKDFGNVVMVLVLLSEQDPVLAVRTAFLRAGYLLVPLSVLFIKYIPELGRTYNQWTWQPQIVGVGTHKNELGTVVLVSSLFLFWHLLDLFGRQRRMTPKKDLYLHGGLVCMVVYLFWAAGSVTSLLCAVFGVSLFSILRSPAGQRGYPRLELSGLAVVVIFSALNALFNLNAVVLGLLGRDPTLTGRTEIWKLVLEADVDPLFGVGFYTYWMGGRAERVWEAGYAALNQAHNGYLETYLNNGLVGVGLLLVLLLTSYTALRSRILAGGDDFDRIRLVLLLVLITYNFTEAAFNRMGFIWFAGVLALLNSLPDQPPARESTDPLDDMEDVTTLGHQALRSPWG